MKNGYKVITQVAVFAPVEDSPKVMINKTEEFTNAATSMDDQEIEEKEAKAAETLRFLSLASSRTFSHLCSATNIG